MLKSSAYLVTSSSELAAVALLYMLRLRILSCTIVDRKTSLPCNHLDVGAFLLPTLAHCQNKTGDWLMPS